MMMPIDALILSIYEIVTRDDALKPMLASLAEHFGCRSAALVFVHPRRPEANITAAHGPLSDPQVQATYERDFAVIDPAPTALTRLAVGEAATTDEIFKDTLPLYHRFLEGFYYPLGLRGALGGPIATAPDRIGIVAVHRGPDRAPFDEGDVAGMGRLAPHVARAVTLRERFFALDSRAEALETAFEPLPLGLMLFDDGRLTGANASARSILARADGLSLDRDGALTSPDAAIAGRLRRLTRSPGAGILPVARAAGGAYVIRSFGFAGSEDPGGSRRVALLVCDTEAEAVDAAPLLREVYGMPAQAARLIAELLKGGSLESYAAAAGLTRNTAKFHLKAAFAATGARRQTDLIRRVAPLVHAMASPDPRPRSAGTSARADLPML